MYPAHPLGREVLGSESSIKAMSRDSIGRTTPRTTTRRTSCSRPPATWPTRTCSRSRSCGFRRERGASDAPTGAARHRGLTVVNRSTEQDHVVVGVRALPSLDPDRYAFTVLNQTLGGGMSSRLFQEVREERGLAYSVVLVPRRVRGHRLPRDLPGTAPDRVQETLGVIGTELDRLVAERPLDRGARRGEGAPRGLARDVAGDVVEPDAPHRTIRAGRRRGAGARRSGRRTSLAVDRRRRRARDRPSARAAPRTLAVVGPHEPGRLRGGRPRLRRAAVPSGP